jgi:PilZ domain-containing protein
MPSPALHRDFFAFSRAIVFFPSHKPLIYQSLKIFSKFPRNCSDNHGEAGVWAICTAPLPGDDVMMLTQESFDTAEESHDDLGAERRRGLRIQQNRPIKVLDTIGGRFFGGQTHDVSATGLKIELPLHATVRKGEMLNIHVGLSQSGEALANRRQMIPARVVWVNRSGLNSKMMTAGVEFSSTIGAQLDAA